MANESTAPHTTLVWAPPLFTEGPVCLGNRLQQMNIVVRDVVPHAVHINRSSETNFVAPTKKGVGLA